MSRRGAKSPEKIKLRRRLRERRDALSPEIARQASAEVCLRLATCELLKNKRTIAGYIARGQEIDLRPFLSELLKEGRALSFPRVTGPGTMEFCTLQDWKELKPGAFGIDEPSGEAVDTDGIELFFVPGLAFDQAGNRLGFGMGFYDRALPPKGEALAIGVGHHFQLLEEALPAEPHDRAMDFVVTDRGWHKPPGVVI